MRNPLQDQLLKAGLVKKSKVAQAVREQEKHRHGKAPVAPTPEQIDAQRLQVERAERDRALAAERNASAQAAALRAQVRQIVEMHKVKREGEIAYRFSDGEKIHSVLVDHRLRAQLAGGTLVIARHDQGYALVPRAAAEKIRSRDAAAIVLDHGFVPDRGVEFPKGGAGAAATKSEDDAYYAQFKVPDDLIW
ncbi:MAG: DUF2058 domain-containing protein [Dokdonella sp.]